MIKYDMNWVQEKNELRKALIDKRVSERLTLKAFSDKYGLNCKDLINFIYQDSLSSYSYYKFREVLKDD